MKQSGGAVAGRKGSWNDSTRNMAAVPESLPGVARINDNRFVRSVFARAPAASAPSPSSPPAFPWQQQVARLAGAFDPRRIVVGSAVSVSLCQTNRRLGQRAFAHLPSPARGINGNTREGAYMCEADAQGSGNRAAKSERHP
jgi:hypothetical protein